MTASQTFLVNPEQMKPEKLILIGSSGLIGKSLLNVARSHFSSILCVGSTSITSWNNGNNGKCTHSTREDKLGWSDLDKHLDSDNFVINASWGRNNRVDRNSQIQMEYANRELRLIYKVNNRTLNYLSFGSIAEVDDTRISPSYGTLYSKAKIKIFRELEQSSSAYLWIRLASIYGHNDKRDWLMNQLIAHAKSANRILLKSPNLLINLCQVDALAQEIFNILEIKSSSALNIFTKQWVTVKELSNSFGLLKEPNYSMIQSLNFSQNDPRGYLIETPPFLNFIRCSTSHE